MAKIQTYTGKYPDHGKEQGQMQLSVGFLVEYLAAKIPLDYWLG